MSSELIIGLYRRLYNKNLKKVIEQSGLTAAQIQKKTKITQHYLSKIINFRRNPNENEQIKLAILFEKPIDELFPENYDEVYQRISPLKRKAEIKIDTLQLDSPEVLALESGDPPLDESAENALLKEKIKLALKDLDPRAAKIIKLRFGIDGNGTMTYEEVGKEFGLSKERIRQIEAKALDNLKEMSIIMDQIGLLKPENR